MSKGQFCENCIHRIVCDHESKYRKACSQFLEARPHGEWVETDNADEIYGISEKCTNCGALILSTHMSYCGNCGADMRKEGEKE